MTPRSRLSRGRSPDHVLRFEAGVLCRIECRREDAGFVVDLAGRPGEAHVPDFLQVCAHDRGRSSSSTNWFSADAVGIDALLRVERQGARLAGLPEYLRLTLDTLARERCE